MAISAMTRRKASRTLVVGNAPENARSCSMVLVGKFNIVVLRIYPIILGMALEFVDQGGISMRQNIENDVDAPVVALVAG